MQRYLTNLSAMRLVERKRCHNHNCFQSLKTLYPLFETRCNVDEIITQTESLVFQ